MKIISMANRRHNVPALTATDEDTTPVRGSKYHGMNLISISFTGKNFVSWSKAVYLALGAKAKIGYIDGSIKAPEDKGSTEYTNWRKADCLVAAWILGAMSKEFVDSFISAKSARILWKNICERYDITNGTKLYTLKKNVYQLKQGHDSIDIFYGKLKKYWDELDDFDSIRGCTCGNCTCDVEKQIEEKTMNGRLVQFLMGMNDEYDAASNQILIMDPLPSVNKAYSIVQRIEQ